MDKIEKVLMEECDRLEKVYMSAEPGSNEEYFNSIAHEAMYWMYTRIGFCLKDDDALPVLKIVKDSLDRVMGNISLI